MPEHAGNHRGDDSLAGTVTNLTNRPRQVRQAIHAALTELGDYVVPDRIGVIGHSLGGYTALALAGGRRLTLAGETPDGRERRVDVESDPRVRAIVLLAPAVQRSATTSRAEPSPGNQIIPSRTLTTGRSDANPSSAV